MIGGRLVARAAAPDQIVAVDSEHSALAQCLRGGSAAEVDRLILTASGGPFRGRSGSSSADVTPAAGAGPPHLGHGPGDHHQLGDPGQQGAGAARGPPALRRTAGPDRRRRPSAVDRALDGAVRRRLDPGPVLAAGHAAADRARARLAGPAARRGPSCRLDAPPRAGRSSRWTRRRSRRWRWPGGRPAAAAPHPRSSTRPTRCASTPSTRAGSASWTSSTSSTAVLADTWRAGGAHPRRRRGRYDVLWTGSDDDLTLDVVLAATRGPGSGLGELTTGGRGPRWTRRSTSPAR